MSASRSRSHVHAGVTLIELMVAMVLGLIVIGGTISVVLANRQSYRTSESLSQVQESARTAFELLARDARQAGATGCDNTGRVANVLRPSTRWWQNWITAIGYDNTQTDPAVSFGTAATNRVEGTDSLQLRSTRAATLSITSHNAASAQFVLNATNPAIAQNDILLVCDFDHAAIFQATTVDVASATLSHTQSAASGNAPGNCSQGLGYPTNCGSASGNVYTFGPNALVAHVVAMDWYVGHNGRTSDGGRSLYRVRIGTAGTPLVEEVVSGVRDMQLQYRVDDEEGFVAASALSASDWDTLNAIAVTLTLESANTRTSTELDQNAGRVERTFTNIITLRNKVP